MTEKKLGIVLTARDASLQKGFDRAGRAVNRFAKNATARFSNVSREMARLANEANKVGQSIKNSLGGVRSAIAAIGGTVALAKPISEAKNFELQLANVNTLLDGSGASIDRYRTQLLRLAQDSPKTLSDLSTALYQTISAGIPAVDGAAGAFGVLEVAQKAAVAGLSTTEESVDAFATSLNAFKDQNLTAAEAGDKLLNVVQKGRITFPELAQNLGTVATVSAKAGVEFDELSALFITLTRAGIKAPKAATGIRALISSIQKPSSQTIKLVKELNKQLPKTEQIFIGAKALREKGLTGVLESLTKATGGSSEALAKIFPNIRALTPALVTVGDGFAEFKKFTADSANSVGKLDEAFVKVDGTFSNTFEKFKSTVNATLVEAGGTILPKLNAKFKELIDYIGANSDQFIGFFEDLASSLISLATWVAKNGGPIVKIFKALFVGKMVGLFAKALAGMIPIIIGFKNVAIASFTAVTASANTMGNSIALASTKAGASGGAAAAAGFGAKLTAGLGKLARNAGLIGVLIAIGAMLAEIVGNFIGDVINKAKGIDTEAIERELKEQRRRAKEGKDKAASAQGFKNDEEKQEQEDLVQKGVKLELIPEFFGADLPLAEINAEVKRARDVFINQAKMTAESQVAERVPLKFLQGFMDIEGIEPLKVIDFEAATNAIGKISGDLDQFARQREINKIALVDGKGTEKQFEKLQELARKAKNIKQLKIIVAEQEDAAILDKMLDSVLDQVKASEAYEKTLKKRFADEESIANNALAGRKAQIVDLNQFIADQEKQRLAVGVEDAEAAEAAKAAAMQVVENNIIDAQRERVENEKRIRELAGEDVELQREYAAAAQKNYTFVWQRRNALNEIVDRINANRSAAQGLAKTNREQVLQRLRVLNALREELRLTGRINEERQKRVNEALGNQEKGKGKGKKKSGGGGGGGRLRSERARFAKLLEGLEKREEKTERENLKIQETKLQLEKKDLELAKLKLEAEDDISKTGPGIIKNLQSQTNLNTQILAIKTQIAAKDNEIAQNELKRKAKEDAKTIKKSGRFVGELGGGMKRFRETALVKRVAAQAALEKQNERDLQALIEKGANEVSKINKQNQKQRFEGEQAVKAVQEKMNAANEKSIKESAKTAEEAAKKLADAFRERIEKIPGAAEDFSRFIELSGLDAEKTAQEMEVAASKLRDEGGFFGATVDEQLGGMLKTARSLQEIGNMLGLESTSLKDVGMAIAEGGGSEYDNIVEAFQQGGDGFFSKSGAAFMHGSRVIGAGYMAGANILKETLQEGLKSFAQNLFSGLGKLTTATIQGAASLDFEAVANSISSGITGSLQNGAEFLDGFALRVSDAIEGSMTQSFGGAGAFFGKLLGTASTVAIGSLSAVLSGAAVLFEKVFSPIAGALGKPIATIFDGFSAAIDSIFDTGEKSEQNAQERQAIIEANEAHIRTLRDQGATNEEIAAAQAQLASSLEAADAEAEADPITKAFENALMFVEKLIAQLPALVDRFLKTLIEKLPDLISGLVEALAGALVAIAENFGDLLQAALTGIVEALPALFDALVEALPLIIEGILNAITFIIQELPNIITNFINMVIEMLPKLIEVLAKGIPALIVSIIEAVPKIIVSIIEAIPLLIEQLVAAIPVLIEGLIEALPDLITALISAVPSIIAALIVSIPRIIVAVIKSVPQIIASLIMAIPQVVAAFGVGIYQAALNAFGWVKDTFNSIINFFKNLGGGVSDFFGTTAGRVTAGILTLGVSEFFYHKGGLVRSGGEDIAKMFQAVGAPQFADGGMVFSSPQDEIRKRLLGLPMIKDDVPAILQSGEAVLNRNAVTNLGADTINALNSGRGDVNVDVGLSGDQSGLDSLVSALLPMILGSVNIAVSQQGEEPQFTQKLLGYKPIRGN